MEVENKQGKEEQVAIKNKENKDCVNGQHDYKHKGINEDLLELCCLYGEEMNEVHSIKVEQVAYYKTKQLVDRKEHLRELIEILEKDEIIKILICAEIE